MIDLCDNTNLWGAPPSAARALREMDPARLAAYPGADGGRLRTTLAAFLGLAPDTLALGCGSDELIDLAFRLAGPGASLTCPEPNFSMVPVFASANGLRAAANGDVCYLSTPNNPTGALVPDEIIRRALGDYRLVVIDGAYAEFADGPDWFGEALEAGNTLVLRTLSKAWGLAGLRIGYAVGAPALIARILALRSPYSVNAVAEAVGVAALEHDADWMRAGGREVIANRERLCAALRAAGASPLSSHANFVLLPVGDARAEAARLLAKGVAVRVFEALPLIGDAIRVGIGPWPLMERFLDAFAREPACA